MLFQGKAGLVCRVAAVLAVVAVMGSGTVFGVTNTWDKLGSSSPFTMFPTGTNSSTYYRVGIGTNAAQSTTQLYVLSQQAAIIPFIVNTQANPSVDIARFQKNGATKVVINDSGLVGIGTTNPRCFLDVTVPRSGLQTVQAFSDWYLGGYSFGYIAKFDYDAVNSPYPLILRLGGSRPFSILNGPVGIGTTNPRAKLEVTGNVRIDDNDLYLRSGSDVSHGLGYYGAAKYWTVGSTNYAVEGPVLYGYNGGMLGTNQSGTKKYALYWSANGLVGIGTTAPTQKLEVGSATNAGHIIQAANGGWRDAYCIKRDDNIVAGMGVSADKTSLQFFTGNTLAGNERVTISGSGNVGIGITSPDANAKLDVAGNVRIEGPGTWTTGASAVCKFGGTGENNQLIKAVYGTGMVFQTFTNNSFIWQDQNGTAKMTLDANVGRLGIGTTAAPTEMLEVNGNVKCASVKIGGWILEAPDYVFDKSYKLPSLQEVEKKIITDKHLPDVPSAVEMKKKGMDLCQLNMTLLKKVEELTLYAIDQDKKMELQNKMIEEQSKKIAALENKMAAKK